jgi:flagellar assembly factor FliW
MSISLQSTRFGHVEIDPGAVIEIPDGLIGLPGTRYALISAKSDSPFPWLHSLDDGALALPVTNPHRFFADFRLAVNELEARRLGIDESTSVDVYVTVRAAPVLADFVANLRAPIIVHAGRGYQVINQAPGSELRAPLFPATAEQSASSAA